MQPSTRAGFVLGGILLVYLALLVPHSRAWLQPVQLGQVAFVLATAALLFAAGQVLTEGRLALAGAVATVFFFLLNPVILQASVAPATAKAPQEALYVLLFCLCWIWMKDWSPFMRAIVSAVLFGIGLGLGAHSCFWIVLALVPWVLFSRRPLGAAATLLTVTLLGSLLYSLFYAMTELARGQSLSLGPPLTAASHRLASLWMLPNFLVSHPELAQERFVSSAALVSLPWIVLALWAAGGRLAYSIKQRRADPQFFMATLVILSFVSALGNAAIGHGFPALMSLTTHVTLSAPLVAADLAQRDYFLNRPSRMAALLGALSAGIAAHGFSLSPTMTVIASAAASAAAVIFTFVPADLRRLSMERRWRAVLAGASVGSCLTAAVFR